MEIKDVKSDSIDFSLTAEDLEEVITVFERDAIQTGKESLLLSGFAIGQMQMEDSPRTEATQPEQAEPEEQVEPEKKTNVISIMVRAGRPYGRQPKPSA